LSRENRTRQDRSARTETKGSGFAKSQKRKEKGFLNAGRSRFTRSDDGNEGGVEAAGWLGLWQPLPRGRPGDLETPDVTKP
jgi:hypothetical protein